MTDIPTKEERSRLWPPSESPAKGEAANWGGHLGPLSCVVAGHKLPPAASKQGGHFRSLVLFMLLTNGPEPGTS